MKQIKFVIAFNLVALGYYAQNEQDALRYSRLGANGSTRFTSMGGAFGALGADISCAAYNPAGLGVFRKGEFSISTGLKFTNATAQIHNQSSSYFNTGLNLNNIGFAAAWQSERDAQSRNIISISLNQPVNFNNSVRFSVNTNSASIAKDMLNLSVSKNEPKYLNSFYEGLGFDAYLIDTSNGKFFSFLDTKRTVRQTRNVTTAGKVNDVNFSFAHSLKDYLYFGVSLSLPQVSYESTTTHTERDEKDSMRVTLTSANSYSTTYVDGLPEIDRFWLGFDNMSYTEYFKTTGSGFNLKLGMIARFNEMLRVGAYYHTPTIYSLNDVYYNAMTVTFDGDKANPITSTVPKDKGTYKYKIYTPSRLGVNAALIYKKLLVVGLDYENLNYSKARLQGEQTNDFNEVNSNIAIKYGSAHNLRVGVEFNVKPYFYRIGYNMLGSPDGKVFTGNSVRNTFSLGFGFRTARSAYFDFAVLNSNTKETYELLKTIPSKVSTSLASSSILATVGFKF